MFINTLLNILICCSLGILLFTIGSCSTGPTSNSREILSTQAINRETEFRSTKKRSPSSDFESSHSKFNFEWPVEDARMTRGFLPNKRRPHWGIDLAANRGSPIYSAHPGMVIYAGKDFHGFGKMVLVESGTGWATLYAHLDKILVDEGQTVTSKDILGLMGKTGRATGVHLHFEIRKDKGPVDPLDYLPGGPKIAHRI